MSLEPKGLSTGGLLVHRNLHGMKLNKKSGISKNAADKLVRGIKRKTRKRYSVEEKNRIVLTDLRGEENIARADSRAASPKRPAVVATAH